MGKLKWIEVFYLGAEYRRIGKICGIGVDRQLPGVNAQKGHAATPDSTPRTKTPATKQIDKCKQFLFTFTPDLRTRLAEGVQIR